MSNRKSRLAERKAAGWKGHGWGVWGSDDGFVARVNNPPAEKQKTDRLEITPIFGIKDSAMAALEELRNRIKK